MKFARYLEDNCTPEWKRAYIDYRRLKKQIKLIQSRQSLPSLPSGNRLNELDHDHDHAHTSGDGGSDDPAGTAGGAAGGAGGMGMGGLTDLEDLDDGDSSEGDGGPVADFRSRRDPKTKTNATNTSDGPSPTAGQGQGTKWWNKLDLPRAIESTNMQASRSDDRVHEAVSGAGGGKDHYHHSPRSPADDDQAGPGVGRQDIPTTSRERQRSITSGETSSASYGSGTGGGKGYGSMGTSPALRASRSGSGRQRGSGAGTGGGQRSGASSSQPGGTSKSLGGTGKMTRSRSRSSMIPPELRLPDSSLDNDDDDESGGDLGLGSANETGESGNSPTTDEFGSTTGLRGKSKAKEDDRGDDKNGSVSRLTVPESHAAKGQDRSKDTDLERSESRATTGADSSSGDEDGNVVARPPGTGANNHLQHIKSLATRSPRLDSATGPGRSPRLAGTDTNGNGTGGIANMLKSPSMKARAGMPETGDRTMSSRTLKASPSGGSVNPRRLGVPSARFPDTLQELYDMASPEELRFLQTLDNELEKVESFYHDRESDALKHSNELKRQLDELAEHRRVFHEAEEERMQEGKVKRYIDGAVEGVQKRIPFVSSVIQIADPRAQTAAGPRDLQPVATGKRSGETDSSDNGKEDGSTTQHAGKTANGSGVARNRTPMNGGRASFDPEKYQRYKKKLRTAILEFYKELEILKNYRILNITGFKKALKKFEKTARIKCIDLYMDGKVAKRSFADGQTVDRLLKQMEDEFTLRFEKGNHKKAVGRLRGQFVTKTHHMSTFSSGTYIGVGLPLMILGLVEALRDETRLRFPQVEALLLVYSALFLPVLFGMLFELNLAAFVAARINYGFIMELDIRTAIDHRQFLEIPAMLFAALSICFYFSVHRVGEPAISPYAWPVVWLVGLVTFFLNPVPVYFQHARYWLLSVLGRVCTPGYSRVEFIAFFVADELNSLTYTIGHLWTIGCAYNRHWPADTLSVCRTSGSWVFGLLVCIPAFIRFVQCMKRFKDSRLKIHLINAGKYVSSMLQLAMFTYWRSRGSSLHDHSFAIWATSATLASTYTSAWDLLIDWGLLRPHAGYLRESLGYPTIKPYYYVAMVSNVIVRFIWVWYIPKSTKDVPLKSFIFATMEMLRRWQWNFFRVETEQVGNTDQYRVTREVPLPYRMIQGEDDDDDEEESLTRKRSRQKGNGLGLRSAALALGHWRQHMLSGRARKRQPDRTANAGPRGDDAHRDYSPRQNDDMIIPMASPDRMSALSEEGLMAEEDGRESSERAAERTL